MAGTANSGGHNAKTREELARSGTLRKDRHGDMKSPEPTAGRPEPPKELSKAAQDEWDRMIWCLEDMGTLCKVDGQALYQYCSLYAETEAVAERQENLALAVERLEENLADFKGEEFLKLIQELTQQQKLVSKCTDQLRSGRAAIRPYLVEFGMTPSSRGRVKLPAKAEAVVDPFEQHQMQRLSRVK